MLRMYSIVFNFGVPRFQPELSNSLKWTNITNGRHLDWENFDRLWGYRSYASGWSFPPGNRGEVLRQSRREKKSNVMLKVKAGWLWSLSYREIIAGYHEKSWIFMGFFHEGNMVGHFFGGYAVIYWIHWLGVSCCACSTQILEDAIGILNLDLAYVPGINWLLVDQ